MKRRGVCVPLVMAAVVLAIVANARTAWAERPDRPAPPPRAAENDSPGLTFMAAVAGAAGSFFYVPFKAAAICPGMALASAASLAVTGGDREAAAYLLRVGCGGTYYITPGMVRGQEEFQGGGGR